MLKKPLKNPQKKNAKKKNPTHKQKIPQTNTRQNHHPVQNQKETRRQQLLDKDKIYVDNKTKAKGLGWFVWFKIDSNVRKPQKA